MPDITEIAPDIYRLSIFNESIGLQFNHCSDLFTHFGAVAPLTDGDLVGRARESLENMQRSPLAYYIPYNARTGEILNSLADLKPGLLATMHGSSFNGDCAQALRDLDGAMREVLGR